MPLLRQAAKDVDSPATSDMALRCLDALEKHSTSLTGTAARLIAVRRPKGAAEALLEFLPAAEDDRVIEEVRNALVILAYRDDNGWRIIPVGSARSSGTVIAVTGSSFRPCRHGPGRSPPRCVPAVPRTGRG